MEFYTCTLFGSPILYDHCTIICARVHVLVNKFMFMCIAISILEARVYSRMNGESAPVDVTKSDVTVVICLSKTITVHDFCNAYVAAIVFW